MCYRYVMQSDALRVLAERLGIARPLEWRSRYNLAPSADVPVVRASPGADGLEMVTLRWGLVPAWTREAEPARAPANARAESLASRPMFRDAFRRRRCLVPASGFYEWQGEGGRRQPYLFRSRDGSPLCFAGVWEAWRDPAGDRVAGTCAIITTAPNGTVRPIHDRIPAILPPEDCPRWLDARVVEPSELAPLLRPLPDGVLTVTAVSTWVNSVRHDDPACLEPARSTDAGGPRAQFTFEL
ncbi:MAG TPA: SOS response-associated peptidase [Opitutaceae bacterium]|nr:SOS response-associated peptidase [Opitutaceae bacterium]